MKAPQANPRLRAEFAHLLRGIAAGSVLLSHLAYTFWRKPEIVGALIVYDDLPRTVGLASPVSLTDFGLPDFWGHFGVALFFLISGFVIPFSTARRSRRAFAIARVFRIWPTYMTGLTIGLTCLAINAALSKTPFPYHASEILNHYLILPRWPTLTHPIDGIVWTLEIELFFYAYCLLIIRRLKRFDYSIFYIALLSIPMAVLAGAIGGALVSEAFRVFALLHWASSMVQFVSFMLIGTAFHYNYFGRLNGPTLAGAQLLLFLAFAASWHLGVFADQGWSGPLCYLIAYFFFALAYLGRDAISVAPAWLRRPFDSLADISYPLYAVHGLLGYTILVHAIEAGMSSFSASMLTLAAVIAAAVLLHVGVEVPGQSFGKSLVIRFVQPVAKEYS